MTPAGWVIITRQFQNRTISFQIPLVEWRVLDKGCFRFSVRVVTCMRCPFFCCVIRAITCSNKTYHGGVVCSWVFSALKYMYTWWVSLCFRFRVGWAVSIGGGARFCLRCLSYFRFQYDDFSYLILEFLPNCDVKRGCHEHPIRCQLYSRVC